MIKCICGGKIRRGRCRNCGARYKNKKMISRPVSVDYFVETIVSSKLREAYSWEEIVQAVKNEISKNIALRIKDNLRLKAEKGEEDGTVRFTAHVRILKDDFRF